MRIVILYLALVGLPILGILGLLQIGQGLIPPNSVKGTWSVTLSPQTQVDASCVGFNFSHFPPALTVVQSGPQLQITWDDLDKTTMAGEIHDATVTADGTIQPSPATANGRALNPVPFHVEAQTDGQAVAAVLHGQITLPSCTSHATVAFTAIRQHDSGGQ